MNDACFLGLDFGTESVRAVVVDRRGATRGSCSRDYAHGQIVPGSAAAQELFHDPLPAAFALQHPGDWLISAAGACRGAVAEAGVDPAAVAGIGVDFTSCTMLPCRIDGTPLCLESPTGAVSRLAPSPHAWPKLWKHHGALEQTERINRLARQRDEPWLKNYGGIVGLEWFFPKVLEVIEKAPEVAAAAEIWLEGGDWLVWQLIGAPGMEGADPAHTVAPCAMPRSTCHAGYKGLWSPESGFPSTAFLAPLHRELARVVEFKMHGVLTPPGQRAGGLCPAMAGLLGLREGTPVSASIIDAHAGVPGAGVGEVGTLVMVLGTSGCHMLLAEEHRDIPGVAGIVRDGILPGSYGYETGQAATGDAFDFVRRLIGGPDFDRITDGAERVPPGCDGVLAMDWFNGCRTPLMDGSLSGAFIGLTLERTPEHLYRSVLEASAYGLRWIVDTLRGAPEGGVPVERFVATGGLPRRNELFMRIVASVLGEAVAIHPAEHGSALGAAILGALAAGAEGGGFDDVGQAVRSLAGPDSELPPARVIEPEPALRAAYQKLYPVYRRFADELGAEDSAMRWLAGAALRP